MIHKPFFLILIFALFYAGPAPAQNTAILWNAEKSEHFIIYYRDAPREYLDELVKNAERYYNSITAELGFTRFDGFWTWDKRARIYLYKDIKEYQDLTKPPIWAGAGVNIHSREISTYVNMSHFFESILPHELGHIIFREFVGFDRRLPIWMDEGVVSYLEKERLGAMLKTARTLVRMKSFMTLEELTAVRSPETIVLPYIFYSEAASVIGFLMDEYGKDKFVSFCQRLKGLRQGEEWFDAMKDVYGFKDLAAMNEKWVEFLRK